MRLIRRIRARLTYANVMSSIAVFVALGGGAYALSVPRNSVGTRQIKRSAVTSAKIRRSAVTGAKIKLGAVTSAQVRDRSLRASDLAPGVIPSSTPAPAPLALGGAHAADTDPPATPGAALKSTSLTLNSAGKAFVLATLNQPSLTCPSGPCQADWGIYVDSQAVPATGLHLQAAGGSGDGYPFYALYGLTPTLPSGVHTVSLNMTTAGSGVLADQFAPQLGAIAVGA
jgi:hypothetical protein